MKKKTKTDNRPQQGGLSFSANGRVVLGGNNQTTVMQGITHVNPLDRVSENNPKKFFG